MKNDPNAARTPDAPPSTMSPTRENAPNRRSQDKTSSFTADALMLVGWTVAACLLTLVNRYAGFAVRLPPYPSLGAHLLALVYLAALLMSLLCASRAAARLPQSTGFLLTVGALLAVPMAIVLTLQRMGTFPPLLLSISANNFFLIIAAALAGAGIGRIIRHPNTLLAGAGFALFFDIVVVTMGTVAQLMQSNSSIIAAVSVGAGAGLAQGPPGVTRRLPDPISGVTIGPADVLFLAVFQAAVHQMNLSRRATFAWMYVLLLAALAIVEIGALPEWLPGIPALVPMGVAVLIANARHGAFTMQEKRDLKIGAVFAIFCAAAIIFGSRALIKPAPPRPNEPRFGFQLGLIGKGSSLYVGAVEPNSVVEKAGIRAGDEIITMDGLPTNRLGARMEAILARGRQRGLTITFRHKNEMKVNTAILRLNPISSSSPVASPSATP